MFDEHEDRDTKEPVGGSNTMALIYQDRKGPEEIPKVARELPPRITIPHEMHCWILPTPCEVTPFWATIAQNKYFAWQETLGEDKRGDASGRKNNPSTPTSLFGNVIGTIQALFDSRQPAMRIVLKMAPVHLMPGDRAISIASSNSEKSIEKAWNWIDQDLAPILEREYENSAGLAWEEIVRQVTLAIKSTVDNMARGTDEATLDDRFRNSARTFRRIFDLSDSERLVNYYSCSLGGSISHQGWIYISEHFLGFYSFVMGIEKKILIELRNIHDIRKERSKKNLISDSIAIRTSDGVELLFTNMLLRRDEAFDCLQLVVNRALHGLLEGSTSRELSPVGPEQSFEASINSSPAKAFDICQKINTSTLKENLDTERNLYTFIRRFQLPSLVLNSTALIFQGQAVIWWQEHPENIYEGQLFISESFLCLAYKETGDPFLVFPLAAIRKMEKIYKSEIPQDIDETYVHSISTMTQTFYLAVMGDVRTCDKLTFILRELLLECAVPASRINEIGSALVSEQLVSGTLELPNIFGAGLSQVYGFPEIDENKEATLLEHWKHFFINYGRSFAILRNEWFHHLLSKGYPGKLRGELWAVTSGSIYYLFLSNDDRYRTISHEPVNKVSSLAIEEIKKDVHRSLPEYQAYLEGLGLERLAAVLINYAKFDQQIGYCQGMNIITAVLLIYLDERTAFWTLFQICKIIAPGYYSPDMHGAVLDQTILEALVKVNLPLLWWHLEKNSLLLSTATLPWFLTFFIGTLDLSLALKVMDHFLAYGPVFLLRFSLAILSDAQAEIIENVVDDGALVDYLKVYCRNMNNSTREIDGRSVSKFQFLLHLCHDRYREVINFDKLEKLRSEYKRIVINRIAEYAKRVSIREAIDGLENLSSARFVAPKLSKNLPQYYDAFQSALFLSAPSLKFTYGLDFDGFVTFILKSMRGFARELAELKGLKISPNLSKFLLYIFQRYGGKDRAGRITFAEIAIMLVDLCAGAPSWAKLLHNAFCDYDALKYCDLVPVVEVISEICRLVQDNHATHHSMDFVDELLLDAMSLLKSFKDGELITEHLFLERFSQHPTLDELFQSLIP